MTYTKPNFSYKATCMFCYTIAADLPGGVLIYAAGEAGDANHDIRHIGKLLLVVPVVLTGTPEEILKQIDQIADIIQKLRRASLSTGEVLQVPARTAQSRPGYSAPARH